MCKRLFQDSTYFVCFCLNALLFRRCFVADGWGVNEMYLKFKAAKTAIVGMMTTPWLSCQFRDIATSSYSHVTTDHLRHRLKQNRMNTKQSRTDNSTKRQINKERKKERKKKKDRQTVSNNGKADRTKINDKHECGWPCFSRDLSAVRRYALTTRAGYQELL